MPTVSVIVPNYNHAIYLPARINSILEQHYTDFELILLDDCSTDNSSEILETYRAHPKVSAIVYNDINSGSTFKQWNKGIQLARGKYIWLAESDDYCRHDLLQKTVEQMEAHPSAGIVYVQSIEEEQETNNSFLSFTDHPRFGQTFLQSYFNTGLKEVAEKLVYENTIPNASAVLFSKSVYQQCGGADESMRLCGDWLLWAKMLLTSDVYFIAEPLNHFRLTGNSVRNKYNIRNSLGEKIKVLGVIKHGGLKTEAEKAELLLLKRYFNSYKLSDWKEPFSVIGSKLSGDKYLRIAKIFLASIYDRLMNRKNLLMAKIGNRNDKVL